MRRLVLVVLMVGMLVTACQSAGPKGGPEPGQGAPAAPPSEGPAPAEHRPVALYLAGAAPVIRALPGVEMAADMADLKAKAAGSPRAIWLDVDVKDKVDRAWLQERYLERWPVVVLGQGAQGVLLDLLGVRDEAAQAGQWALRQQSLVGAPIQVLWTPGTPVTELFQRSLAALKVGDIGVESVDLLKAPVSVREFGAKYGKGVVAQTLTLPRETYLFLPAGRAVTRAQQDLGTIRVFNEVKPGAPQPGVWKLRSGTAAVAFEPGEPYLFQVNNYHRLPEVPITAEGALVTPTAGARGGGSFLVTGYVRAFEAAFSVRVKDGAGKVLAEKAGMASVGGGDFGSFVLPLPYQGGGQGILELLIYSPKDGSEIILARVAVEL